MHRHSIASLAALVLVAPAIAAADDPAPPPAADEGLEEIVITAQRRVENAQEAALAISVVSPEALTNAGVTNPLELSKLVPALQIVTSASTFPILNIRGITNLATNTWSDAAVLFNYDGVPIARATGIYGNFYDLERVEVLKGPQGTLYGRNATGGAINVLPKRPELGTFGGDLSVELGNFDLRHVTGAVNVPVTDKAALRGAFDVIDRDGYYSTGTGDNVGQSGRLQFLVRPTDALSVRVGADYYHQGGRGPGSVLLHAKSVAGTQAPSVPGTPDPLVGQFVNPSNPWTDINDPRVCAVTAAYYSNDPTTCNVNSRVDSDFWGLDATIDYDLGFATLTVIPAYRRSSVDFNGYNNPTLHENESERQSTAEARLTSNDSKSPLKWVVGGFWIDDPDGGDFGVNLHPASTSDVNVLTNLDTRSWATFAQGTYSVLPWARVTGGVRYTNDEKTFKVSQVANHALGPTIPPGSLLSTQDANKTWTAVTWKAGLEFDVAQNSLVYFNDERGYHSGGFFNTALPNDSYRPEIVHAYTIGSKNLFFDRRLQVNIEAFHYLYTDQQISHYTTSVAGPVPGVGFIPLPGFITENVGKSRMWGVELDLASKVTETTLLTADVQWLDAKYQQFVYSAGVAPLTSGCSGPIVSPSGIPNPAFANNFSYDCSGKPMVDTPTWRYTAGIQQTLPLANGAAIVGTFNANVQSRSWVAGYDYLSYDRIGTSWSGDMTLGYRAPEERWSVTGFVNNLTNEATPAIIGGNGDAESLGAQGSPPVAYLKPPRTYGIRGAVHF